MNRQAPEISNQVLQEAIERNVRDALAEDVGSGDLTAQLIPEDTTATATVITREKGILCGTQWFSQSFTRVDQKSQVRWFLADGDVMEPGQVLCEISGRARSLLTSERAGLNFLQMLSGVASKAWRYSDAVSGTGAKIVDTRKTLPGLRIAEKYAVACGGAFNHRVGLYDAVLIKENHILAAGSIAKAMQAATAVCSAECRRCKFIEIEVETLAELEEAIEAGAAMVLLDNMSLEQLAAAVKINNGRAILEASGNVTLETVRAIAETGVDRISVGGLTKNVRAVDLSMRLKG